MELTWSGRRFQPSGIYLSSAQSTRKATYKSAINAGTSVPWSPYTRSNRQSCVKDLNRKWRQTLYYTITITGLGSQQLTRWSSFWDWDLKSIPLLYCRFQEIGIWKKGRTNLGQVEIWYSSKADFTEQNVLKQHKLYH